MIKKSNKACSWIVGVSLLSLPLTVLSQTGSGTNNNPDDFNNKGTGVYGSAGTTKKSYNPEGIVNDANRGNKNNMNKANFSQSTLANISSVLTNIVVAAADGDINDVIDNFAKTSRERLENETEVDMDSLENRSESFQTAWDSTSSSSFKDSVTEKIGNLEIVSGDPKKNARVRLTSGSETVELNLVNEGMIGDSWKIEAPQTLTREQLNLHLDRVLTNNSKTNDSTKVAAEILKTMSNSQQVAQVN